MATTPDVPGPASEERPAGGLKAVPGIFWAGLAAGILGFFVSFTFGSTRSVNGSVTDCTQFDMAGFLVALGLAYCIWDVLAPDDHRLKYAPPKPMRRALAGVLAVLAILHVLRGLGIIMGGC